MRVTLKTIKYGYRILGDGEPIGAVIRADIGEDKVDGYVACLSARYGYRRAEGLKPLSAAIKAVHARPNLTVVQ